MGSGTLKVRSPSGAPVRSLHWSPMLPTMRYPASTSFCRSPDLYGTTDEPRDDGLQGTNTGDTGPECVFRRACHFGPQVQAPHSGSTAYSP